MKISIVTSVYNRASTISSTLESVRLQNYSNLEHVVQDGGSTDGTLELVHRHGSSIVRVYSERDSGIYDGINRGITRAAGDVIGLLHSDDVFSNRDVISTVARAFEDPMVDGVYGDLVYVAVNDSSRVVRYWKSGPYDPANFRAGWMPPHPTVYLRRSVFSRFGLYDTSFRIAADYEAMLRYFAIGRARLYYLPEVMVRMRVGGESNRSFGRIIQKTREDYRALRRHSVGGVGTLLAKNFRKLGQFSHKEASPE